MAWIRLPVSGVLFVVAGLIAAACGQADTDAGSRAASESVATTTTGDPLSSTSHATSTSSAANTSSTAVTTTTFATTLPPKGRLVIQGAGDTNLDPSYIPTFVETGYGHALSGLGGQFNNDSLTFINLECTPSNIGERQDRPFNFRCDPDALPSLIDHGVEAVNLANNHSMDYGPEALVDSIANVEGAGLISVGVGANRTEAFASATYEVDGWSIGLLGFGALYLAQDWLATDDRPGMSDGLDLNSMVAAVEEAKQTHDLVVVSIHWCCELQTEPNARNREHAEAMVAAGADVIFGHHHHRLQPLEIVDGSPVFWGLGNFVWPRFSAAGSDTAIGRVEIGPDGSVTACLLDATIESHGHPVLDDPTITTC